MADEQVYIFGHKNPDTDTVCSSIAYAELKRQLGHTNAAAYVLGNISEETAFVLDYFKAEAPPLLTDVKVRLGDLDLYAPRPLSMNEPLKTAWSELTDQAHFGSRLIPVTGDDGRLLGLVSMGDITSMFMEGPDYDLVGNHEILFDNLVNILGGRLEIGNYNYPRVMGNFFIGYNFPESTVITDKDIIVTNVLENAMRAAYINKFGCVILTDGVQAQGLTHSETAIVTCDATMFKTMTLIKHAISVGSIMQKNQIMAFSEDDYVDDIMDVMKTSSHRNFPVLKLDGSVLGIISRRHLIERRAKQVILIDHNEKNQSAEGIESASILEIIDHHRVADVQTDAPLYIRSEPVGCTSTIIRKMYGENGLEIPPKIAGLMLAAILSDTLLLTSPTCTHDDRMAAYALSEIAQVDMEAFGQQMFLISTSVSRYSAKQILSLDRKRFGFGLYNAYISQVNTLDFTGIRERETELIDELEEFCRLENCDLAMLLVTSIKQEGSLILVAGKRKEIACDAFEMDWNKQSAFLPGIVSRKKQVVPKLVAALQ